MPEQTPDFGSVLAALNAAQVRFLLVGGLAMVSHGSAHITQDIDVVYARDADNLAALERGLAPYHPRLRGVPEEVPFMLDAPTLRNTRNLTLETTLGDLDLLSDIAGMDSFEGLWERSVEMDIEGIPVRVASLDDLIAMKRAANRPKDRLHLMELLALRKLIQQETEHRERP